MSDRNVSVHLFKSEVAVQYTARLKLMIRCVNVMEQSSFCLGLEGMSRKVFRPTFPRRHMVSWELVSKDILGLITSP